MKNINKITRNDHLALGISIILLLASCQFNLSHVDVTKMLSERTGKDVVISERNDTLIVKLRGERDSVAHESLGNVLNLIVKISLHEHFASFNKNVLMVILYEKKKDNSPLFIWVSDADDIKTKASEETKFPNRLKRLEFFVKHFTVNQLISLDHITNVIHKYEGSTSEPPGFLVLFWETHILFISNANKTRTYIQGYLLEYADDPENCPNCNKAALKGFFSQCEVM